MLVSTYLQIPCLSRARAYYLLVAHICSYLSSSSITSRARARALEATSYDERYVKSRRRAKLPSVVLLGSSRASRQGGVVSREYESFS